MSDNHEIRIGYACLNTELRDSDIFTSRSLTLATARKKGFSYINALIESNIDDLFKIIIYNEAHGIRFYRISSCVFPHLSNPLLDNSDYDITFIKSKLKIIGKYAKKKGHRLTMHPGQYVQLASLNPDVVSRSITELENHVKLLEMMGYGLENSSVLILHGGGTHGDKTCSLNRWEKNYWNMPEKIRKYIVLENDEYNYGVMDLLPFCEKNKIPLCLDVFHNRVAGKNHVVVTKSLMRRILNTWNMNNIRIIPKIHFSDQQIGLRRGAHSKTINELPDFILKIPKMFNTSIDVMLEVKDKEVSVFKIYYKYFDMCQDINGRISYKLKNI